VSRQLDPRRALGGTAKYAILVLYAVLAIFPLVWVFLTSLKGTYEVYANPIGLPLEWKWANYARVWGVAGFLRSFVNSLVVSTTSVATLLLVCAMAAYVLTRVWPNRIMITFFTLGIMIPGQALLIPLYIMVYRRFGIGNTLLSLFLVYTGAGISFSTFLLLGFLKSIPRELEEAAFMDGYSRTSTFFTIILPLSKAGLATVGVFELIWRWNEFLLALLFVSSPAKKTLTLAINSLKGMYITDFGLISAGLMIAIAPAILFFILFQEQVMQGMTAGALKG
jgi:raffinose/stachyose/melibiose transport system permease protein